MNQHPGETLQETVDCFVGDLQHGAVDSIPIAELAAILESSMKMTGRSRYDCAKAMTDEFILRLGLRLGCRDETAQVLALTREQLNSVFRIGNCSVN